MTGYARTNEPSRLEIPKRAHEKTPTTMYPAVRKKVIVHFALLAQRVSHHVADGAVRTWLRENESQRLAEIDCLQKITVSFSLVRERRKKRTYQNLAHLNTDSHTGLVYMLLGLNLANILN